jgi:hypothetical protein
MHIASVENTAAAIHVTVQRLTRLLVGSSSVNVERIAPVKHAPVAELEYSLFGCFSQPEFRIP